MTQPLGLMIHPMYDADAFKQSYNAHYPDKPKPLLNFYDTLADVKAIISTTFGYPFKAKSVRGIATQVHNIRLDKLRMSMAHEAGLKERCVWLENTR